MLWQVLACVAVSLLCSLTASATQLETVRGIVRDSLSMATLPYVRVKALPSGRAVVTDSRGIFSLAVGRTDTVLELSTQGYATARVRHRSGGLGIYDVSMRPQAQELKELEVRKQKYSKRNNPAVDFVRRIRSNSALADPTKRPFYSYDKYERMNVGLTPFDTLSIPAFKQIPELKEHIISSEIDGSPVFNISLKERMEHVSMRADGAKRSLLKAIKTDGLDDFLSRQNSQALFDEAVSEIDPYSGGIRVMQSEFVSPLSIIGPDFYRYYLVDSAAVIEGSDRPHIELAFYPMNKATLGFTGRLFVEAGDTTMSVKRVEMSMPSEANINFVKDMRLVQTYDLSPDGVRYKTSDRLDIHVQPMPNSAVVYLRRHSYYSGHSLDAIPDSVFAGLGQQRESEGADSVTAEQWEALRAVPLHFGEKNAHLLMHRLRKNKFWKFTEDVLKLASTGYVGFGKDSKFDFGPINTFISYNSLEGLRLKLGGMTLASFSKQFFLNGYVAYGCADRKWKYMGQAEYSFNKKKSHAREFPVHSISVMQKYDVDRLGAKYEYTDGDNFFLSWERRPDRAFTYERVSRLQYTLELANHLSVEAAAVYERQEASPFVPFVDQAGRMRSYYDIAAFDFKLRFSPGETFFQTRNRRVRLNPTPPVFTISHRYAPAWLGSNYALNQSSASVSKIFAIPAVGTLRTHIGGGYVWGTAPFPELYIPNANLSYTVQWGSFAMLNPMEFINSAYAEWHAEWTTPGLIFNTIPGIKKLGLREVLLWRGVYGKLADRCRPSADNNLLKFPVDAARVPMDKPYMEIGCGIDNIFHLIRLDYVWRLNYLNVPYPIDRHGLRFGLHVTF